MSYLRRPIIIVGAPRSGTTLLARVLESHPDVAMIPEPRLTWRWGNDSRSDMLRPEHATDRVIRHIRDTLGAQVAEQGRTRLLEKTPSNSLRIPFVDRVFPDAVYVHILRDGVEASLAINSRWHTHSHGFNFRREVIARRFREIKLRQIPYYAREVLLRVVKRKGGSGRMQNIWGPRIPGIQQMLGELDAIDIASLQWRMCVEAACLDGEALGANRYMECRLEDLNEDTLLEIMKFCDLSPHPDVMKSFRDTFDSSATAHRRGKATAEEIERVRRWIEPTMQWLEARMTNSSLPA